MTLTPLITAAESLTSLERLCASAEQELCFSFPHFDPQARLHDPRVTERGLETWSDLIAWLDRRGVALRILLADVDPLFSATRHRRVWRQASGFADVVQGDAQVLCAPHGQAAGILWRLALAPQIRRALRRLRNEDSIRLTHVQRTALSKGPVLRPAAFNQAFAIADGQRSLIGGPDMTVPGHDAAGSDTHAIAAQVLDTDFSAALRGHFMDCWNAALDTGATSLAARAERFDTSVRSQSRVDMRLLRTFSVPRTGMTRLAPEPYVTDHEHLLVQLFSEALRYIYVETRYLRHAPVIEALTSRAITNPDLQLILLLPSTPEHVPLDADDGWDGRHGPGLQAKALDQLQSAFGDRLAVVTPARSVSDLPVVDYANRMDTQTNVILVDDAVGIIGSANLNGRSLRWDCEVSVLFRDAATVARLMDRLADVWLGAKTEGDPRQAACWTTLANQNASHASPPQEGAVLPYPIETARKLGQTSGILPDEMF